jgi:hypothetical protein
VLALRGFIRLTSLPSDRTPDESTRLLADALSLAKQANEKKLVLGALPRYACPAALKLAEGLTGDADVAAEAKAAATRLAQALKAR